MRSALACCLACPHHRRHPRPPRRARATSQRLSALAQRTAAGDSLHQHHRLLMCHRARPRHLRRLYRRRLSHHHHCLLHHHLARPSACHHHRLLTCHHARPHLLHRLAHHHARDLQRHLAPPCLVARTCIARSHVRQTPRRHQRSSRYIRTAPRRRHHTYRTRRAWRRTNAAARMMLLPPCLVARTCIARSHVRQMLRRHLRSSRRKLPAPRCRHHV